MRKDKLGKFYDRLDPDERFRLGLKAAARGDEEDDDAFRALSSEADQVTNANSLPSGPPLYLRQLHQRSTTCLPTRPREGREPCLGGRWQERESTNKVVEKSETGGPAHYRGPF